MTEQQFEELLKNLAVLTEEKKIAWIGDAKTGYELDLGETRVRLRNIEGVGIILTILNSEGKIVARVSNTNMQTAPGIEFFKSSIPHYIWQLILRQSLRTDETLEKLLSKLRDIK